MRERTESEIFAHNMNRLMILRGLTNARLSEWLDLSREMVRKYRSGKYLPSEAKLQILCKALGCETKDLFTDQPQGPAMMPLREWARREDIPVTRARDLFDHGVLQGAIRTKTGTMIVPKSLHAPEDSKWQVRIAKVRPPWVEAFWNNFPILLDQTTVDCTDIAKQVQVSTQAIDHWAHARNYPKQERLPAIAAALGCSIDELITA